MAANPIYTIFREDTSTRTLQIFRGYDKIEEQLYYTFDFDNQQTVITQYNGRWIDNAGKDHQQAGQLGSLLEQLEETVGDRKTWTFIDLSELTKTFEETTLLIFDGQRGAEGIDHQVQFPIGDSTISFNLQSLISADNQVLRQLSGSRLHQLIATYKLYLERPGRLLTYLRTPRLEKSTPCYFGYVQALNGNQYIAGVTFDQPESNHYLSHLMALIELS
ncbi:hypothetical protein HH214_18925 [Mucilaginibacter robiniae]|uniref:Uncharacterized protein n=1 Tax=Mucilaginibacter robiniae TaxID=2728022 RepID=A0A7L5E445_9SPHI|nr:hypothetical protein [Mucilaginibacter robiniae]QJD97801.1 hypothetical protein HH214_18925 [Mucilaginibacter robiniae]